MQGGRTACLVRSVICLPRTSAITQPDLLITVALGSSCPVRSHLSPFTVTALVPTV